MKIDKIYRLMYTSWDAISEGDFYTTREEALKDLDAIKQKIEELYADADGYPADGIIYLRTINMYDLDDIPYLDTGDEIISKWIIDKEYTEDYRKDKLKEGIISEATFYKWDR